MKLSFILLPLIYICANGYLYIRTLQAISCLPLWGKVLLSAFFWVAAFALFIAIGLRESNLPGGLIHTFFSIGSVWIVFLLYGVLFLAATDLIRLALPLRGYSICYALPLTCALLVYGYVNYLNPKVEHLDISLETKADSKLRIVAVSDIHLGYGTSVKTLRKYVEMINSQQPDIVLITGDLIDNSIKPIIERPYDAELAMIDAKLGIYMVPGNHEYISGIDDVVDYLSHTNITLLRDSIVSLPNGIQIIGRDDRFNTRRKPLDHLLAQVDRERPAIVLDHQPYKLAKADSLKVDLLLCGHTHHGQVFPFNLITDRIYEQSHGYRKWDYSHIWVSSGLALWGPPFRIGTHSDMAVIDIH